MSVRISVTAQPVPYISPLLALREQALDMRVHHADERAVRRDARHDRVEGLADATAHGVAAMRFVMSRSTFRAASALDMQLAAIVCSSLSV
jgi:hypothetical protein